MSDMERARTLWERTMKATTELCTNAVREAEKAGNKTFFVVIDGSRFGRYCARVLPHGEAAAELPDGAFDRWAEAVDEALLELRIPCQNGSGDWTLSWEDEGQLTAYHPSYLCIVAARAGPIGSARPALFPDTTSDASIWRKA